MKKIVLMIVVLIVSAIITPAWAQTPQMHRFLKPEYHNKLSDEEYKVALKGLFEGNTEIQSKYWNPIPTCSYDQMRYIYAQHLMKVYRLPELPTPAAMVALVGISEPAILPATVQTAGIVKGTANLEYFSRNALANERGLKQGGVTWTIQSCGNPGNIGSPQVRPATYQPPAEEFDRPGLKTEFASYQQDPDARSTSSSSVSITMPTVGGGGNNSGGMSPEMMMMWATMMNQQNQQRSYQQSEVVVKNKPNAWEVIAGITGIANLGLNVYNTVRPRNNINVFEQYYSGSNGGVRPSIPWQPRPDRPDRPPYVPPVTINPWQGGSGSYPNPYYGNNSNPNGAGLGTGYGTIWGGSNGGGATYRLPVSPTYQW